MSTVSQTSHDPTAQPAAQTNQMAAAQETTCQTTVAKQMIFPQLTVEPTVKTPTLDTHAANDQQSQMIEGESRAPRLVPGWPGSSDRCMAPHDARRHEGSHAFDSGDTAEDLLNAVRPSLFFTLPISDSTSPQRYVLNVATMQAVALGTCKRKIVEAGKEMIKDGKTSVLLPELLHRYCNAVRDMDYIQEKAAAGIRDDPFHIHTCRSVERELLRRYGVISEHQYSQLPPAPDAEEPQLPGLGRLAKVVADERSTKHRRLYYAIGGGMALVLPMLVMVLVPGRTCSLVTTTACVLAFACVVALGSDLKPQEILGVTAAYAAVLVVFVGTSLE
ncbi:hypothetical protein Q7P37_009214 [Cladosporium fusiforme]